LVHTILTINTKRQINPKQNKNLVSLIVAPGGDVWDAVGTQSWVFAHGRETASHCQTGHDAGVDELVVSQTVWAA
jgi:hypothetical protein